MNTADGMKQNTAINLTIKSSKCKFKFKYLDPDTGCMSNSPIIEASSVQDAMDDFLANNPHLTRFQIVGIQERFD